MQTDLQNIEAPAKPNTKDHNNFAKIKFTLLNLSQKIISEIKLRTSQQLKKIEELHAQGQLFKIPDYSHSLSKFLPTIEKYYDFQFSKDQIIEEIPNFYKKENQKKQSDPFYPTKELRQVNETQVYINGLPPMSTNESLFNLFQGCGEILTAIVPSGEGQSRGFGFVTFTSVEGAQEACKMNGIQHMGRTLKVQLSWQKGESSRKVESKTTVFVGNLSFYTTESSLFEFFKSVGDIKTVRLAKDENGNVKGYAHVEFFFPHQAFEALKLNESLLNGRPVRIELAGNKKNEGSAGYFLNSRIRNSGIVYGHYPYGS